MNISKIYLIKHKQNKHWDFGNKILYNMCKKNFAHKNDGVIIAKVLFIGRIYAAAIERRKKETDIISDDFYIKKVVPAFRNSSLDKHLKKLKKIRTVTTNNIGEVCVVHYELMKTVRKITRLNKRSFCSKYLHFHLPEHFFIYDSRVQYSIRKMKVDVPAELKSIVYSGKVDLEYAKFYCKSFYLKRELERLKKTKLTNRQFDNLLIEIANKKK